MPVVKKDTSIVFFNMKSFSWSSGKGRELVKTSLPSEKPLNLNFDETVSGIAEITG